MLNFIYVPQAAQTLLICDVEKGLSETRVSITEIYITLIFARAEGWLCKDPPSQPITSLWSL